MTIRQTGAGGRFVDTLLQVVALDDVVGLLLYSAAISVAVGIRSGSAGSMAVGILKPMGINLGVVVLGFVFGWLMKLMMPKRRTTDNRLIIAIALLFSFCGICTMLEVSPLLGCMSMGMAYENLTDDEKLFRQLNYFSPPILLLFFVRSGANFRLDALFSSGSLGGVSLLAVSILYFFARILGKYGGAYLGCLAMKQPKESRRYLGLALIPQAGVAIGLSALGARTLGGEWGAALQTIILASSVLYELIGPAAAKLSLSLSHSYGPEAAEGEEPAPAPSEMDYLIHRVQELNENLPERQDVPSDEEQAFLEAAAEQLNARQRSPHSKRRF